MRAPTGFAEAGSAHDEVDAGCREHYEDALLYDYEYRRRRADVNFYKELVQRLVGPSGRILELACGSGRVTIPLARAGYQVVGLDLSAPMLERAEARLGGLGQAARSRVSLHQADMRTFALGERFPLILMAFNSFEHLYTRVDVSACLEQVRAHLAPGGHFVFDVQNPNLYWLGRDPQKRWARTRFTHPVSKRGYIYSTNHEYDPVSQIALIRLYYQPMEPQVGPERVVLLSQRKFFPAELEALLDAGGMRVHTRYGDFSGGVLHGDCQSQVLVCRAQHGAAPGAGPEIVARLGLVRDSEYMYYVKKGRVWRRPLAPGGEPELVAEPGIAIDDRKYVYFLDEHGHIARIARVERAA
jgi:SAM-dependent methyltransferase